MSIHGSPLYSIRSIIERRKDRFDRRHALSKGLRYKPHSVSARGAEAYYRMVETNKRLGVAPGPKAKKGSTEHTLRRFSCRSRAKVTLAKVNLPD